MDDQKPAQTESGKRMDQKGEVHTGANQELTADEQADTQQ